MPQGDPPPMTIGLRDAERSDEAFLLAVYGSTREDELALTNWDESSKHAFVEMQFRAQDQYYRAHYANASYAVIVVDGQPAGRLYVDRGSDAILVIDIALLSAFRGQGIGTRLLEDLQAEAATISKPIRIHVERFNVARRLYERLGFRLIEDQGVYLFLEWSPDGKPSPAGQEKTTS